MSRYLLDACSNITNFSHLHISKTTFKNIFFVNTLDDWYKSYHEANRYTKAFQNIFSKHTKHKVLLKWAKHLRARRELQMERVLTPSLSIIYPLTQKILEKVSFCSFHPFLNLDKRKVGGDSFLPQHFANTNSKPVLTVGSATVSQNWRLCWGTRKVRFTLELVHY